MIPLRIFIFLAISVVGVLAGSNCPPREDIYPCLCINMNVNGRKQAYTTLICQGLRKTDELNAIFPVLKNLEIDKFIIYDSFWEVQQVGAVGENQSVLPNDWFTLTKIKEMEIIDSTLSSCFACRLTIICRNSVTTSFKVMNSSSSEQICTICDTSRGNRVPWLGCMIKLANFQLSHGGLKSMAGDFFPLLLRELKTLVLSYNQISKIDDNVFRNVPNLTSLDLSHNAIETIGRTFGQRTKIEYLDLSYNALKVIGSDLINVMPKIKSLNFAYNEITELKATEWRRAPNSLFKIDLRGNSIHCDCNIRWVNATFKVGVNIIGHCGSPDEYKQSRLRPASRNLIERCDANGVVGLKKKKN